MDRSLWLLLRLRILAWFRKRARGLRTLKGAFLAVLGSLVFLPMLLPFAFAPRVMIAAQAEIIRTYGPLALLAYCVLNVLISSGDRSIHYSLAEVNFLFSGPYRARQLLIYKVVGGVGASLVTGLFMAFALAHHASMFVAAFAGITLSLLLVYLFSLAVGLTISIVGASAYSLGRRLVWVALVVLLTVALWPVGRRALTLPFREVISRSLKSPAVAVVLLPFRPFVNAFTAERVWPDLISWSALAVAVDLALLALVLGLNAGFLEASAAASRRVHDRLRRARRGDALGGNAAAHFALPMLPWWGGVGPNLWRQLTAAGRSPMKLVMLGVMFLLPAGLLAFSLGELEQGTALAFQAFVVFAVVAQPSVGYDFRADSHRIGDLRTLPIRPTRLVLGQLLTPVLVLSASEGLSLALIGRLEPASGPLVFAAVVLLVPVNLLLVAIDNLYFLTYPHRTAGVNSFDVQAIGRQLLLMMTKALGLLVVGAVAGGVGTLVYFFAGESWGAAVGSAAVVAGVCGLALVPVVALAFEQFEVARDRTE